MRRRCTVRVTASSANLGPGFDTFAAAPALRMQLEVEETGSFAVETDLASVAGLLAADSMFGNGAELPAHAAALEGHPDNAAAALKGGFVICRRRGVLG